MSKNEFMVRNFHIGARSAFLSGFANGLAAPVALFAVHEAPPLPEVSRIQPPTRELSSSIHADWCRIGESLQVAIGRYERHGERHDGRQSEDPTGG